MGQMSWAWNDTNKPVEYPLSSCPNFVIGLLLDSTYSGAFGFSILCCFGCNFEDCVLMEIADVGPVVLCPWCDDEWVAAFCSQGFMVIKFRKASNLSYWILRCVPLLWCACNKWINWMCLKIKACAKPGKRAYVAGWQDAPVPDRKKNKFSCLNINVSSSLSCFCERLKLSTTSLYHFNSSLFNLLKWSFSSENGGEKSNSFSKGSEM